MKNALGKAANSVAAKAAPFGFIYTGQPRDNKATLTVGELIVELTDDARRFVRDEKELYEVVAYLLEKRLNKRRNRWCKNPLTARNIIPENTEFVLLCFDRNLTRRPEG